MVKILYYLKCTKIFLGGKMLSSTHQKKCFYKLLGSFWKIDYLTENRPYKIGEILYYLKCAKKIFFDKFFVPLSKEVFLQTFRQFLENWIFDGKSTAADLTKKVKILNYLKMC